MKKFICLILCMSALLYTFSAENELTDSNSLKDISGVWENSSRFIFVKENTLSFVLKPFYGFLYDEAGELPASLITGENGETVLNVKYKGEKQPRPYPICVINDKLFLDFYCKDASSSGNATAAQDSSSSNLLGFWRSSGNTFNIGIALPENKKELECYYFTGDVVYVLRYWRADVEYSKQSAEFTDGDFSCSVDKHLKVGDTIYTCVVGRGTKIRNFEKYPYSVKDDKITFNGKTYPMYISGDSSLLAFCEPYLVRSSVQDLPAEIKEHNSLRHNPFLNPLDTFNRKTAWEKKLDAIDVEELKKEAEEAVKFVENY